MSHRRTACSEDPPARQEACYLLNVPLARVVVLVLALAHAVGVADLFLDDACEQVCSDDDCGTDCIPGSACRCHCPSAMPMVGHAPQTVAKLEHPPIAVASTSVQNAPAIPDPREILHVPRLMI